jgi:hypothetical protein
MKKENVENKRFKKMQKLLSNKEIHEIENPNTLKNDNLTINKKGKKISNLRRDIYNIRNSITSNFKIDISNKDNNKNQLKKNSKKFYNLKPKVEFKNDISFDDKIITDTEPDIKNNHLIIPNKKGIKLNLGNRELDKLHELINIKKKKLKENIFKEIKVRSENKADQILEISLNDYSEIEQDVTERTANSNVNVKNLNRIIRVRNILKGRNRKNIDFKELDEETDKDQFIEEFLKLSKFKKLGPPSFLKTNFKKNTMDKFKMLDGRFFGC